MIYALGFGSNKSSKIGNKFSNYKFTISELNKRNIRVITKSNLYITPPQHMTLASENFINAAFIIETSLKPLKLIYILKEIEKIMGRVTYKKNSSRSCDLDILLVKDQKNISVRDQNHFLEVPHPRMKNRGFVMLPLNDICPNWYMGNEKVTVSQCLKSQSLSDKMYKSVKRL